MAREKRQSTSKAVKYTEEAFYPSGSEEDEGEGTGSEVGRGSGSSKTGAEEEDDDAWGVDEDEAPAAKKRKLAPAPKSKAKGKGKGKQKQGKLSAFQDMPLDILCLIAQHLDPATLLFMSRANKSMRALFASKSSASMWQIVQNAVYLPQLTAPGVNPLKLASVLYENNCSFCGRGRSSIIDYALLRRFCKNCQRANVMTANKVKRGVEEIDREAIACSRVTHKSISSNWATQPHYCLSDVRAVSEELIDLRSAVASAPKGDERDAAKATLQSFIERKKAAAAAVVVDKDALLNWSKQDLGSRKSMAQANRDARQKAVIAKLLELGYEKDDTNNLWQVWNLIDQPTPLTDLIWRKISPQVIATAERNKVARLGRERLQRTEERRKALRPYYDALSLNTSTDDASSLFPGFNAFTTLPSVKPFWEAEDSTVDGWNDALPAVQADLVTAGRALKVGYARIALSAARSTTDAECKLLQMLAIRRTPRTPTDSDDDRIYHSYSSAGLYNDMYRFRSAELDSADIAPDVTEAELDEVLARFTAQFSCTGSHGRCNVVLPFPAIHQHLHDHHADGKVSSGETSVPDKFVDRLKEIVKLAQLEELDGPTANAALDALGSVFSCEGCAESMNTVWGAYRTWDIAGQAVKSKDLEWGEMKRHLVEHHSNPYASTRGVKIGITPSALRQLLGEEGYQASLAAQEAEKRRAEEEKQAQAESARAALAQRVAEAAEARAKAEMEREEQRVVEELENEEQEDLESLVAMQEQDQEKAGEAAISDGRPA